MQPFVKNSTKVALTTPLMKYITPSDSDESQSTEDGIKALDRIVQHLYFKDPIIKEKVDEISQTIWILTWLTQT